MSIRTLFRFQVLAGLALSLSISPVVAEKQYGPGVSDTEIKIGQTMAYSGPASTYGTLGRAAAAYFAKINAEGGIGGRKITFLSLDDGYSPPKTVEQTRGLVERYQVLMIFGSLGTAPNSAVRKYLNSMKVPQLFLAVSATKFGDPETYPWTMGWQPPAKVEATVYAKFLRQTNPEAKIAILYLNDDFGKDLMKWFKAGLGEAGARNIVAAESYELNDPTVDSQIIALQASGAEVLLNFSLPKAQLKPFERATISAGDRSIYPYTCLCVLVGRGRFDARGPG